MSGFTTTGASVVTDFDEINRSLGMWRQFTQWLGGMGIIVLAIAVLPRLRVGGRQLMESELPGPEIAALSERIRSTRGSCGSSTSALTALQALMLSSLWVVGIDDLMTPYQAVAHAFATMPTGGFSTQPDSAAASRRRRSGSSRSSWRSPARTSRSCTARSSAGGRTALARDEEFRLYVAPARRRVRRLTIDALGDGSPRARPRSAPPCSRPSRS